MIQARPALGQLRALSVAPCRVLIAAAGSAVPQAQSPAASDIGAAASLRTTLEAPRKPQKPAAQAAKPGSLACGRFGATPSIRLPCARTAKGAFEPSKTTNKAPVEMASEAGHADGARVRVTRATRGRSGIQRAFAGDQFLLHEPKAETEAVIWAPKGHRLLRLVYEPDEDRGYESSAAGKNHACSHFRGNAAA